jgi:hypothetical protein
MEESWCFHFFNCVEARTAIININKCIKEGKGDEKSIWCLYSVYVICMYIQYTRVCPYMVEWGMRAVTVDKQRISKSELSSRQTGQTAAGEREVGLWQETETGAE